MPKLTVIRGADQGLEKELRKEKEVIICGRQEGAGLQLTDTLISSQHFRIVKRGDALTLSDLNSKNGVMVNDAPVKTAKLQLGDVIAVGESRIAVQAAGAEASALLGDAPEFQSFALLDLLGSGGMGTVYKARQISLDRIVALKVLPKSLTSDPAFVKKFIQEARSAGGLNHPNLVQIHDVGEEDGFYYICMEFIPGGSLGDLLKTEGAIDVKTAVRIASDVAHGLEYAEQKGIVHCDIKPDNIMLTASGDAKITDLGIAIHGTTREGAGAEVLGSPHFMAPEQAQGKALDHRTDIYALGCTLFRMIAGRTPFSGANGREVMKAQVASPLPNLADFCPDAPPQLNAVIKKMMAKDPDKRFSSAKDIVRVLANISYESAAPKEPVPAPASEPKSKPKVKSPSKRKKTSIQGAPMRREGSSVNRVKRSRSSQSSSVPFLPIGIGVLILGIGLALAWFKLAPDPAKAAQKARVLKSQGNLDAAYHELQMNGGTRDKALSQSIYQLKQEILAEKQKKMVHERWLQSWNEYIALKSTSPPSEVLLEKLRALRVMYKLTPEYRQMIDDEIIRVKSY